MPTLPRLLNISVLAKAGVNSVRAIFSFGGPDPCPNIAKHLSVLVHCSGDPPLPPLPPPPPPATLNCSTTGRNCPTEFSAGMNDEVGTFFPFMHQLTFAEGIQRDRLPPPAMMLSRAATAGSWRLGGASWDGDHHCEWTDYINHLCACIPLCHHNLVHVLYFENGAVWGGSLSGAITPGVRAFLLTDCCKFDDCTKCR